MGVSLCRKSSGATTVGPRSQTYPHTDCEKRRKEQVSYNSTSGSVRDQETDVGEMTGLPIPTRALLFATSRTNLSRCIGPRLVTPSTSADA